MLMSRSVDTVIAVAAMLLMPSDTMVIDGKVEERGIQKLKSMVLLKELDVFLGNIKSHP